MMKKLIHVLYLDDSFFDRALVRDALEKESDRFTLTEAASTTEFEALLEAGIQQQTSYDLILTDFNILGFTGLQVLDMVRIRLPDMPVIIVTGTGSEEGGVEAIKRGAADYVIKTPQHIQRLPQTIHTVLEKHQLVIEQRETQQALVEAHNHLSATLNALPDLLCEVDQVGYIYDYRIPQPLSLYPQLQNCENQTIHTVFSQPAAKRIQQTINRVIQGEPRAEGQCTMEMPTGRQWFEFSITPKGNPITPKARFIILVRNITHRKETEEALAKVNRAYRILSHFNRALVRATSETELLQKICQITIEKGNYRFAWVGFAQHDEQKSIQIVAHAGYEAGYKAQLKLTWADTEWGRGPAGTAIRTAKPVINKNSITNPNYKIWRAEAIKRGYASSIALPFFIDGEVEGILSVYAAERDAFDSLEVELLLELTDDLAYGLTTLRTRADHAQAEVALQQSEERYRLVSELISDFAYAVRIKPDGHYNYEWLTEAFTTITGYLPQELRSQGWHILIHPADLQLVEQQMEQAKQGQPSTLEHRIMTKTQQIRWLRSYIQPIWDEQEGQVTRIYGAVQDITTAKQAQESLQHSTKRLRILHQIDQAILIAKSPQAIVSTTLKYVQELIPHQVAFVLIFTAELNDTTVDTSYKALKNQQSNLIYLPEKSLAELDIHYQQTPYLTSNINPLAIPLPLFQELQSEGLSAHLKVPLSSQEGLMGSLNFLSATPQTFTEEHLDIAKDIATQLAIALQQTQLHEQVQRYTAELEQRITVRTRELTTLQKVAAIVSQFIGTEITIADTLNKILHVLNQPLALVQLLNEAGELDLMAQQGLSPELVAQLIALPVEPGNPINWVLEYAQPLLISNLSTDVRGRHLASQGDFQVYLGLPIKIHGQVQGVLSLIGKATSHFSADDIELLDVITDHISVTVENAQLRQQTQQMAVLQERERLARDLHDAVTQSLYSLALFVEGARELADRGNTERLKEYLVDIEATAQQSLREMRLLLYELRPPVLTQEGLIGGLRQRLNTVEGRMGIQTRLIAEPLLPPLPAMAEEMFYRIAQEALNNALKHAQAEIVIIRLYQEAHQRVMEIVDDGQGFELTMTSNQAGMGLNNMHIRAEKIGGTLNIITQPGQGTTIQVKLAIEDF